MSRPKQTIQSIHLNLAIPEPLAQKLELELFSSVEGRVPKGAYKEFFASLIVNHFASMAAPCPQCNGAGHVS